MKRYILATGISSALLLSACSGPSTEEQLDSVLKDTFEAESDYRDTQSEMEELETAEQEKFESIMALTQEQQEDVKANAEEAIASVEQRLELLETEKASMDSAEEAFQEIDTVIEETEDEELKNDLTALKTKMHDRFDAHEKFTAAYEELAAEQKELYEMLVNEETELQVLQEKTVTVNDKNKEVQNAVTEFNEQTEQFNEMKNSLIKKMNADSE
ncbi:YkyA family protein [Planomicrobium okeanokoites]|uniref:YkyA family protein n=1 Tax=Planomicrobium okeanokoites TaxID=244 RepID=UPI0009FC3F92|nr:YkyA family protein [Planomicrobium okeanokoites]